MHNHPTALARIGGLLYLIIIVIGVHGEVFVRERLTVAGDATATAERIAASEFHWRISIAAELVHLSCAIVLALIFYRLLWPVSRDLALLAVAFNLVSITLEISNKLFLVASLFPIGNAQYLGAFEPEQLSALAMLAVRMHGYGFVIDLLFFGWVCLLLGYLIFRSGYFPRTIGILMLIAGLCYLTNSFALIVVPHLASGLFPAIMIPPFVAETSLALWLLVKGVDGAKWEARTRESQRQFFPSSEHASPHGRQPAGAMENH